MERKKASDFDPQLLNLFDRYVHGGINRREFLEGAAKFAIGGLTATALWDMLRPNYALAQQVPKDDKRIKAEYTMYPSPKGNSSNGMMSGLLARPATGDKFAAVVVIHENRGLNPYIEDVVRRLAVAGFMAFGPDAIWPLGGYPSVDKYGAEADEKAPSDAAKSRRREIGRRLRRRRRVYTQASTVNRQAGGRGVLRRWIEGQHTRGSVVGTCRGSAVLRESARDCRRAEDQSSGASAFC